MSGIIGNFLENGRRAKQARARADENRRDCFAASLVEIGATDNNRVVPPIDEIKARLSIPSGVKTGDVLRLAKTGAEVIGLPISRVLLREDAFGRVKVPKALRGVTEQMPDVITVKNRSMILFIGPGKASDHVETKSGWSNRRLAHQIETGREVGAVVEFGKKK